MVTVLNPFVLILSGNSFPLEVRNLFEHQKVALGSLSCIRLNLLLITRLLVYDKEQELGRTNSDDCKRPERTFSAMATEFDDV